MGHLWMTYSVDGSTWAQYTVILLSVLFLCVRTPLTVFKELADDRGDPDDDNFDSSVTWLVGDLGLPSADGFVGSSN